MSNSHIAEPFRSLLAAVEPPAVMDAQWCNDAFWRVNPGGNATVPSLYLLDFAREVLRVHGTAPAVDRGAVLEEAAKHCEHLCREYLRGLEDAITQCEGWPAAQRAIRALKDKP